MPHSCETESTKAMNINPVATIECKKQGTEWMDDDR